MSTGKKLTRSEWSKTPYARSDARNPDGAIQALLAKYGVTEIMTATYTGSHGRPGFGVRFVLNGKPFRVALETLDADASPDELRVQVKRAVYHYVKSALEVAGVFVSPEEALFAFLELPAGDGRTATVFEAARPTLGRLTTSDFGRLMLPPKREEGAD